MGEDVVIKRLIQITVIVVGLTLAATMVKNSKALAKIAGNTSMLADKAKIGKGIGMAQGGAKGFLKNKALNTEARMARSDKGFLSRVGSRRARRKFSKAQAERERTRAQDDAVTSFYDNAEGVSSDAKAEARRRRASGVGGAEGASRIEAVIAGQKRERFGEAMKLEEARLSSTSTGDLAKIMADAIDEGKSELAHAAASVMTDRGKADTNVASEVLRNNFGNSAPTTQEAQTAASIVRSFGGKFNEVAPDLPRWANSESADGQTTINDTAAKPGTYADASPEKIAGWSPHTIQRAFQTAQTADTAAGGVANMQVLVDQAHATLNDPRVSGSLSNKAREQLTFISQGNTPPAP